MRTDALLPPQTTEEAAVHRNRKRCRQKRGAADNQVMVNGAGVCPLSHLVASMARQVLQSVTCFKVRVGNVTQDFSSTDWHYCVHTSFPVKAHTGTLFSTTP